MASTSRSTHFNTKPKSNPIIIRKPSQFHSFRSRNFHRTCKFRSSLPVIRASINLRLIKPIESDQLQADVRNKTMDALDACGGFRVTVGDVSSKAGINLIEAEKALQALAVDTNGFMEVSDEGDILYVFSSDYRLKLVAKSLGLRLQPLINKMKSIVDYIVRVSFGATLIASTVVVFTAIIVILVLAAVAGLSEGGGDVGDVFSGAWNILDICDPGMFWYWNPPYDNKRREQIISVAGVGMENNRRMNFMESVFSFVFGDRWGQGEGNEEERWKLIGCYIASNGGVVAAEELAPFLDLWVVGKMKMDIDFDSYILPVLLRFDGKPEVDEEGNILYRFPSLQRTAEEEKIEDTVLEKEKFFMEKKWEFSKTSKLYRVLIVGLGGFNMLGVLYLGTLLKSVTVIAMSNRFISFVSAIFPLLQIYAAAFFIVPFIRWLFIMKTNFEIENRNHVREECAKWLQSPDSALRMKLLNSQAMSGRTFIGQDRIVYTTERDLVMQDYDTQNWDQRFKHDIKKPLT